MTELLDAAKLSVIMLILISASISDWKRREASDIHWFLIGVVGILCMTYVAFDEGMRWEYALMIIGTVIILVEILWDFERKPFVQAMIYLCLALMFLIPLLSASDDTLVQTFLVVPAAFLIFVGMFMSGLIRGGADTKCLIVLAMVFQTYPVFYGYPLVSLPELETTLIFQFSLMVMFHAALFSVAMVFYYLIRNLSRKEGHFPYIFTSYRMSSKNARDAHVWPIQKVVDGKAVMAKKAQDISVIDDLESIGETEVWVTPMIPFLIPITIAVGFVAIIGNLLFMLPF